MPESAVSKMPNTHNHRAAPPGTAVKYGNGELETIERLVDIGRHYEVQVTPDIQLCSNPYQRGPDR
jgi:hypothetical protein